MQLRHTIFNSIVCLGLLGMPLNAFAQDVSYDIDIEATDAVTALNVLAIQTEHPLLFDYNQVKSFTVNSLEGNYTLQQALNLILKDSGLSGSLSEREVISISLSTESVTQPKEDKMKFERTKKKLVSSAASVAVATALSTASAVAQDNSADSFEDEIIVTATTGSRIKRQSDLPSPIARFDASDLSANAVKDVRDLIGILPINSGSENNSDNLGQNFTAGTSNINLRGLGVASTLVLLNGKRQVVSSAVSNSGATFVDTSALIPTLALERVEILKDGASAIYGSDAVAGVANFITRKDFQGAEFTAEYRTRAQEGSQRDFTVDGVIGNTFADGRGSFLVAASYLDRTSLTLLETDFDDDRPSFSSFGNPATFVIPAGTVVGPDSPFESGATASRTVADPNCVANGGVLNPLADNADGLSQSNCLFDFGPQITVVPNEERLQGYARAEYDITDFVNLWGEVGYARNDVNREVSPSFPVLNTPILPAENPSNVFGADVFFQGRPFGTNQPTEVNFFLHNTVRAAVGLEGSFGNNLDWDVSYVTASNDSVQNPRDTIVANFQAALQGFGGTACDTSPTADTPAVAGENGCLFFDAFNPANNAANDEAFRDFFIGDFVANAQSNLDVIEANLTGSLFELPAGDVGFAIGGQYRDQSIDYRFDSLTQQDSFGLLIGNPNFSGSLDVYSVYGEVLVPATEWLELSGALRFEDYGGDIGTTLDPKFSFLATPTESLAVRGSFSTSFRAPSVFQTAGVQTSFQNFDDTVTTGSSTFGGNRTVGNPELQPETSTAFNIGATWSPETSFADALEFNVDFWDFSFEDVLAQESAQGIIDADPFDSRIERTSAGTIAIVNTAFINAESIDTNGIDLGVRAAFDTGFGTFTPYVDGTVTLTYDVNDNGTTVDALGRLNLDNVGAPTQSLKGNVGLGWSLNNLSANAFLRHVGSYEDDNEVDIDAFTTFDANVTVGLGSIINDESSTSVTVGIVNAFAEDPPDVNINGGYDPRSADPRGRRVFVKLGTKF